MGWYQRRVHGVVVMVLSVSLMNLVTAIIVEGSLEKATEDRELARTVKVQHVMRMLPKMEELFHELDQTGNGTITKEELEAAPSELALELASCFQTDDLNELFDLLDTERSGSVSIDDLCLELVKVIITDRSIDFMKMTRRAMALKTLLRSLKNRMESMEASRQMEVDYLRYGLRDIRSIVESKAKRISA